MGLKYASASLVKLTTKHPVYCVVYVILVCSCNRILFSQTISTFLRISITSFNCQMNSGWTRVTVRVCMSNKVLISVNKELGSSCLSPDYRLVRVRLFSLFRNMLRSSVTSPMRAHHTLRSSTRSSRERHHGDTHDRKRHDSLDRSKLDASSRFFAAHTGNSARSVASRDSALFTEFVKTSQRSPHFLLVYCILFYLLK